MGHSPSGVMRVDELNFQTTGTAEIRKCFVCVTLCEHLINFFVCNRPNCQKQEPKTTIV